MRFAVVSDQHVAEDHYQQRAQFQSALRFAVVSDPTPWHAVLTSPVAAVLHTTPPHPLQQADRTCPQWGKTPRHVVYTPEAVFGRSPTPLAEGVSKTPSSGHPGLPVSSNSALRSFPVFAGCGCSPLHGVASPPGSGPRAGTSPPGAPRRAPPVFPEPLGEPLHRIGDVAVLGVLLQHPLPGATKCRQGETLHHLLLIEKKAVSSHYFPLHIMYEIPNSPCTRRGRMRRKQSIEVLNDSSWEKLAELTQSSFSIRFKVRGGSGPYPLARRPDKPCCGVLTHHSSSPPPTKGQNLSSMG